MAKFKGKKGKKQNKGKPNKGKAITSPLGNTDAFESDEVDDDYVPSNGIKGIHTCTIVSNRIEVNDAGTRIMIIEFKAPTGRIYRERQVIVSSKGNNYYVNKSGKKQYLMGFNIINAIFLLAIGKTLTAMNSKFKTKTMKVWSSKAKKETKQELLTLEKLNGKKVAIGFRTIVVDKPKIKRGVKQYKNNKPVPSGEFSQYDAIYKYFNLKGLTIAEIRKGEKKPIFRKEYMKSFGKGQVIDLTLDKAFSNKTKKKTKNKKKEEDEVFNLGKKDKKKGKKSKKKGKK